MPNTLVHFGVQGLVYRGFGGQLTGLNWVFLGALLPDIPWILRRAVRFVAPGLDPYDLVLYATVQSSLLFCVLLAAGLSVFSSRPRFIFLVLAFNSVLHLILDACEIKWGNGVHFMAPFSWRLTSWGLIWPENVVVTVTTFAGLAVTVWALSIAGRGKIAPRWPDGKQRLLGAVIMTGYLLLPMGLTNGPYEADSHAVKTLREEASRPGKTVTIDRRSLYTTEGRITVRTFAGEEIGVIAAPSTLPGVVSMRGRFVDRHNIVAGEIHYHRAWFRDGASYLGLLLFAALWTRALLLSKKGPLQSE